MPVRAVLAHMSTLSSLMIAHFGLEGGQDVVALNDLDVNFVAPSNNNDDDDDGDDDNNGDAAQSKKRKRLSSSSSSTTTTKAAAAATPARGKRRAKLGAIELLKQNDNDNDNDDSSDDNNNTANTNTSINKLHPCNDNDNDSDSDNFALRGKSVGVRPPSLSSSRDRLSSSAAAVLAPSSSSSAIASTSSTTSTMSADVGALVDQSSNAPPPTLNAQQQKWLQQLLEQPECPICLEPIQDAAITNCNHAFCFECVSSLLQSNGRPICPLCRRVISGNDVHRIQMNAADVALVAKGADGDDDDDDDDDNDDDNNNHDDDDGKKKSSSKKKKAKVDGAAGAKPDEDANAAHARMLAAAIAKARTLTQTANALPAGSSFEVRERARSRLSRAIEHLRAVLARARMAPQPLKDIACSLMRHHLSSKLIAAMELIQKIRHEDAQAKIVVFSQWNGMIEKLAAALKRDNVEYSQLLGDMTQPARAKALERFQFDDQVAVFLLSLRSGAVGLTLTAANHLILIDPCLNKATEEQALNRIYRIGQTRETHVHKLILQNTIEERLHQRSMRLDRGVSGASNASNASNASASRPSDLAVASRGTGAGTEFEADARSVSISEIARLFDI